MSVKMSLTAHFLLRYFNESDSVARISSSCTDLVLLHKYFVDGQIQNSCTEDACNILLSDLDTVQKPHFRIALYQTIVFLTNF
jgi:hypothetical protein